MSTLKDIIKNLNKNNFQIIKRLITNSGYKYLTVKIGTEEIENIVTGRCYSFKLYEGNFSSKWEFGRALIYNITDYKKDMYNLSIPLSNTMKKITINRYRRHTDLRTNSRKIQYILQNINEGNTGG